ncbi:hypothetical protein ES703_49579 [subsurface metagenome]
MEEYRPLFRFVEEEETGLLYIELRLDFSKLGEASYTFPITKQLVEDLIRYFEGAADEADKEEKVDMEIQKGIIKSLLIRLRKFLKEYPLIP